MNWFFIVDVVSFIIKCRRDSKLRFGIEVDLGYGIKRESGSFDYMKSGALYQSTLHLKTNGCLLLSYTPRHLTREVLSDDINIIPPTGIDK